MESAKIHLALQEPNPPGVSEGLVVVWLLAYRSDHELKLGYDGGDFVRISKLLAMRSYSSNMPALLFVPNPSV